MNQTLDLEALRRQAYRADAQDGLLEFLMGIMLFFAAHAMVNPHLAWLPALFIFPARIALRFFKERFTYPRIGYVKLEGDPATPRQFGVGMLRYLAVILLIVACGLFAFGRLGSWGTWIKWMPAIMGGFCSGGFLYAAQRSGFPRHYFLFVACLGWGVACSFLNVDAPYHGMRAWALGLGMLCLLMGISVFLNFLRTHPMPAEEGDNEPV